MVDELLLHPHRVVAALHEVIDVEGEQPVWGAVGVAHVALERIHNGARRPGRLVQEPTERTRRCAIYCASQTRHISTLGLAAEQTTQVLLGTLPRDLASKEWCEALPKRRYEVGRHMLCLGHLFHPFMLTRSVPAVRRCAQRWGAHRG